MSEHDKDTDEQYISELYSALSNESTPAELDKKILSEARQAVDANENEPLAGFKPTNKKGSFLGQWGAPVSLAAVILLSVTVVVTIEKERPYELTSDPSRSISSLQEDDNQADDFHSDPGLETQGKVQPDGNAKNLTALAQKEKQKPDYTVKLARSSQIKSEIEAESKAAKITAFAATAPKDNDAVEPVRKQPEIQLRKQSEKPLAKSVPVPAKPVASLQAEKLSTEPEKKLKSVAEPSPQASLLMADESGAPSLDSKKESDTFEPEIIASETIASETRATADTASVAAMVEAEVVADKPSAIASGSQQVIAEEVPGSSIGNNNSLRSFSGSRDSELVRAIPDSGVASAAFAVSESESPLQAQCTELASRDCLASRQCVLERAAGYENYDVDSVYECRENRNQCEDNFSQAADSEAACIARDGCLYQEADCFCLPGELCVCEGGTPARCRLK